MKPVGFAFRFAIYEIWGRKCAICGDPLHLSDLEIDHVIAQSLISAPSILARELTRFGLPNTFDTNDYENLVPAHGRCNLAKSNKIHLVTFGLHLLEGAASRKQRIIALQRKFERDFQTAFSLASAASQLQRGTLAREDVMRLVASGDVVGPVPAGDFQNPYVVTFAASVNEFATTWECDAREVAESLSQLQVNLFEYVENVPTHLMMATEELAHNGDTIYARVCCWDVAPEDIVAYFSLGGCPWRILNISSYFSVYGSLAVTS